MLNRGRILLPALRKTRRLRAFAKTIAVFGIAMLSAPAARAEWRTNFAPLLAQETAAEGGYPIIEWAIVVVLIGAAVFVICRSSRRN